MYYISLVSFALGKQLNLDDIEVACTAELNVGLCY